MAFSAVVEVLNLIAKRERKRRKRERDRLR